MTAVGVFVERHSLADYLWNQTDGPLGRHGAIEFRPGERGADLVLVIGSPVGIGEHRRRSRMDRLLGRRVSERDRLERAWEAFGVPRERVWTLFYEPPTYVSDEAFEAARRHAARVYAPDPRATHPIRLPTLWSDHVSVHVLRQDEGAGIEAWEDRRSVVCVTSGKRVVPGHGERLEFLRALRRAGIGLELFGRDLPRDLGGRGPVQGKGAILRGSAFTLAIENYGEGEMYVSEKLWDPLLCWSVPLYYGSRAADAMIPPESFVRLPDLGEGGVEAVRRAVEHGPGGEARRRAIAEARRRIMGELRMVEWLRREMEGR